MTIAIIVATTSHATTRASSAASDGKENANKSCNYWSASNYHLVISSKKKWAMCLTSPQEIRHLWIRTWTQKRNISDAFAFARSAWGFLLRKGLLFVSTYMRCSDWRCYDDSCCCCGMSIVVMLTMPSQHSCCTCRQGRLWLQSWSPRPSLSNLRGSFCKSFDASQWWHWLRPLRLVMTLIASIAIGDGVVACCRLPCLSTRLIPFLLLLYKQ